MQFRNMKLGTRIAMGFAVITAIAVLLGLVGWSGLHTVRSSLTDYARWEKIDMTMNEGIIQPILKMMNALKDYRADSSPEKLKRLQAAYDETATGIDRWHDLVRGDPRLEKIAVDTEAHLALVRKVIKKMVKHKNVMRELKAQGDKMLETLVTTIEKTMAQQVDPVMAKAEKSRDVQTMAKWFRIDVNMNELVIARVLKMRTAAHDFENTGSEKSWSDFARYFREAMGGLKAWQKLVAEEPKLKEAAAKIDGYVRAYAGICTDFHDEVLGIALYDKKVTQSIDKMFASLERGMKEVVDPAKEAQLKSAAKAQQFSLLLILGLLIGGVLLALLVSFVITRGITRSTKQVICSLNEGADQVAAASSQVASASQSLAEGASEQAASMEETSSSLEEMESMTRQNADNAAQANELMKDVNEVVEEANSAMLKLSDSMKEIATASEETQKIVKTIDEIAFQTNLLALNAAVEAARAGEAGAGFAVVADEVRNLAMRAAEAAGNTAELIEGTVGKVKGGEILMSTTDSAFSKVAQSAGKVAELIAEIAAASREQSLGIEQVTTAVAEMDKVVQNNAASAEESASASEELSAQAEQMKGMVEVLRVLVEGRSANRQMEESGDDAFVERNGGNGKALTGSPARLDRAATVASLPTPGIDFDDSHTGEEHKAF